MSKIHFQHKETVFGVIIIAGFLLLTAVNAIVLIPAIQLVYSREQTNTAKNPINTEIVNEAIDVLAGDE